MAKATISVSLPTPMLARLDGLVEAGEYDDRSEAVETAVDQLVTEEHEAE